MENKNIILASNSIRRKDLLQKYGVKFSVMVSNADENIKKYSSCKDYCLKAANAKAKAVLNLINNTKNAIIIAADTIVTLNEKIYTKPTSKADAFNILSELSNNTHKVITGVVIIKKMAENITVYSFTDETEVTFYKLTNEQINNYINTDEPYDKAGAYAIQGGAKVFVKSIKGDIENAIGLPTKKVLKYLKEA